MTASLTFFPRFCRRLGRAASTALALTPLLVLLVGSCKTAELPGSYGSNAGPEQFRVALFPDQVRVKDEALYKPARGYVQRAQTYVAGAPETLSMLTAREVSYLFGQPQWERRDASAHVWQYSQGNCVVDFYFYGNPDAERPEVNYADVRDRATAEPLQGDAQRGCLRSVMREG